MPPTRLTRAWFAVTGLVVLIGLVTQAVVSAGTPGRYATAGARVANMFAYFTIESNVLVLLTSVVFVAGARAGGLKRVLWLDALIGIAVTGVVYHVALSGLADLSGGALFADLMLHTVSPILAVLGFLIAAPRVLRWPTVAWSVCWPLAWLAFTLVRGARGGFYPYPFVNADQLGYGRVAVNCVLIAVLFVALASAAKVLDGWLTHAPAGTRSADR
ncbi:Pr6Pr family membrane protein [Amycolatopsis sp. FDAARGOS 1241]|uniref:Pr6Pr family membrane protein n=1 Tax=Amycolatopsis sp. FDAARGOS 1241 TaxID=2778070 RepID=UPI001950D25C|nr:Pr6Pr family membrane protein [Amycolatopsis sp. FDAARGOS 1241]QRP47200.1 Pr6Pr family membrane protein [Amycolatopsis sp. FDAARGOS 1241]